MPLHRLAFHANGADLMPHASATFMANPVGFGPRQSTKSTWGATGLNMPRTVGILCQWCGYNAARQCYLHDKSCRYGAPPVYNKYRGDRI